MIARLLNTYIESELGIEGAGDDVILQARLRRASEQAKIELSTRPFVRVEEDHIASVDGESRHLSFELSRADFEQAIEEMLARTMQSVTTALNDSGVVPSQLDRILLVGGSTRIPRIVQLLAERLGQEPHGEVDPDLCVALGAGVQAGIEMGYDMQSVLVDITPYTFGTSAVGELYGMPYAHTYFPIIRRNSKLPATRAEAFATLTEDQDMVEIKVCQGEDPDALKNVEIGSFRFTGLNRRQGAFEQGLLFSFHLDLDGLLKVHAVERATGRELRAVVENVLERSTEENLAASRDRIEALWGEEEAPASGTEEEPADVSEVPEAGDEFQETLERARAALDAAPAPDQQEIIDLIEDLRHALQEGRAEDAATAKAELDEILFYLE